MANEHFIISTLNLPQNKIKDIQAFLKSTAFFTLKSHSPKKIHSALSAVVKLPSKSTSCGLIIIFLLLAFLQLLIGIAADLL